MGIGSIISGLDGAVGSIRHGLGPVGETIVSGSESVVNTISSGTKFTPWKWDTGNDNVGINTTDSIGGGFGELTAGNLPFTKAGGWGSVVASSSCAVRGKHGNCVKNAVLGTGPPPGFSPQNWSPSANSPLGKWVSSGGPLSVFMAHNNKSQAHTQTKSQIQKHINSHTQEYHLDFKPNGDTKGSSGTTHFKNKRK